MPTKLEIIKQNTEEIITEKHLQEKLDSKKQLSAYYGTAPTGPVHIGYLIPLSKIFDFEQAGIKTKILLADIHSALDDQKTKWEELKKKTDYYKKCIELAFPWSEKPQFVKGSSFQLKKDYVMDMLRISTLATVKRTMRAASEVTRMKQPKVSELIYPIMQTLDEKYLDVDIQLGGIDQRHIMAFARDYLVELGYEKRVEVMTPLVASLQGPGTKMSASIPMSHIKIYDSEDAIKQKIRKAYCPVGVVEENPILQLSKFLIFPVEKKMKIERDKKFGGDVTFNSYDELEIAYIDKKVHPLDVKNKLANSLIERFGKARKYFEKKTDILTELGHEFMA